jgi:hypothetical protein
MSKIEEFINNFDSNLKSSLESSINEQNSYKSIRASAITSTEPNNLNWPDDSVKTIGQLMVYVFPNEDGEPINLPTGETRVKLMEIPNVKTLRRSSDAKTDVIKWNEVKNFGAQKWFDNFKSSALGIMALTKVKITSFKNYNDLYEAFNDLTDKFRQNFSDSIVDSVPSINNSVFWKSLYEAFIDGSDNTQAGATQSGATQSDTQTTTQSTTKPGDYKITIKDPKTDIAKKIEGTISFEEQGLDSRAVAVLNNLPNPFTNSQTNLPVENNTGSLDYTSEWYESDIPKNSLVDIVIRAFKDMIANKYGVDTTLQYEEAKVEPVIDENLSVSTLISATESNVAKITEFVFNVEQENSFYNADVGYLTIIYKQDETFIYGDDVAVYDAEYTEGEFEGENEIDALPTLEPEEVEEYFAMAEERLTNPPSQTSSGKYEGSATIVPSKLNKNMTFVQVTEAVISNLEGGYFHPDMTKDGRIKDSRYSTSGETMFGLDRVKGDSKSAAAKKFWGLIDTAGARTKWKWNHMPKQPLYGQLVEAAAGVIEPMFNKNLKKYCSDANLQKIIKSDGRLLFNVIYAQWNGDGWIKGLLKVLAEAYNNGSKTSEDLLKETVLERIRGGYTMYKYGTGKKLGSRSASLITQGGRKIAKLTGVKVA